MKVPFTFFIVCCFIVLSSNAITAQANNSEDSLSYDKKLFNVVNDNYPTVESFKNNVQNLINEGADPNGIVEYRYTFKKFGARIPIIQSFYKEKYKEALIITTPFHWAVTVEDNQKAKILLDQGANVNSRIDGNYPIDIAIKNNDFKMITLLVENESKVKGVNIAELRDPGMVDFLIKKGADSTKVNFNIAFSDYDLLKRYISYNPTFKNITLDYRYLFDDNKLFDFLMENGMPTSVVGTDIGNCKLIIGATQYQNEYALKKIIEKGGSVNEKCYNSFDVTPLTNAIKNKNEALVGLLLNNGADPNLMTFMNKTPLEIAIDANSQNIIEKLVDAGANTDNSLIDCVKKNKESLVLYFIEKGADLNYMGFMGNTPLLYAIGNENYNIVKILIKNGAEVNYYNKYEGSSLPPLTKAVKTKDLKMVKLLVENGANPHIDARFNSPIRKAKTLNVPEIVTYLESLD
ncbi:MAG: ankyrin repeat domain-containing protein [Flavobacteriaceae bacterium]